MMAAVAARLRLTTVSTGFHPESWVALYAAVAGSAAALTGLLFVALSMNLARILSNAAHIARGRQALGGLLSLLVLSLLLLIPGQSRQVLGSELLVLAVILVGVSVRFQGRTIRRLSADQRIAWTVRTLHLGTAAIAAAGISLIIGAGGGLYWLPVTLLTYFLWSALNAWTLVIEAADPSDRNEAA
jgi:modulator of FtsH protease